MSKHKYLLKLFSTTCVLFFGVFYYRHQQALSLNAQLDLPQGSNLKISTTTSIYHNNKYGYSFTYPSHLFVEENAGKFGYVPADENADIISFFSDGSPAFTQNLSIWPQDNISLPEGGFHRR